MRGWQGGIFNWHARVIDSARGCSRVLIYTHVPLYTTPTSSPILNSVLDMENGTNTFLCHLLCTTIHMYNIRTANRLCGPSRSWHWLDRSTIFSKIYIYDMPCFSYECVWEKSYIWCFTRFIFICKLFPIKNIFEMYYDFR